MGTSRLLAIVTDPLEGEEPIEEVRRATIGNGVEVRVVVPAVEGSVFQHVMGDVDPSVRRAEHTLEASLSALRQHGVDASGAVGDSDPVQAAQDALRELPADEVLIFERAAEGARWFEDGLFERAQAELEPPLRMVVLKGEDVDPAHAHVVEVEEAGAGTHPVDAGKEVGSAYLPGLTQGDLAGMVAGILGTIVAIVLAAAGPGPGSTWGPVSILVAIAIALVNMAHVVGLTLFESVSYRGGFAKFFRNLSLVGTPLAVLVNLLILLLG